MLYPILNAITSKHKSQTQTTSPSPLSTPQNNRSQPTSTFIHVSTSSSQSSIERHSLEKYRKQKQIYQKDIDHMALLYASNLLKRGSLEKKIVKLGGKGGINTLRRVYKRVLQRNHRTQPHQNDISNSSIPEQIVIELSQKDKSQDMQPPSHQQSNNHKPKKPQHFTFNFNAKGQIQKFYLSILKDKEPTPLQWIHFINLLTQFNPLFHKISPILSQALLKLGHITTYLTNETIYQYKSPLRNIGLILWGQALMRKNKFKFCCNSGCALAQELLFQSLDPTAATKIDKGEMVASEGCKAVKNSGVLWVGVREWGWVGEEFAKKRMKNVMLKLHNVILRIYVQKRQMRKTCG